MIKYLVRMAFVEPKKIVENKRIVLIDLMDSLLKEVDVCSIALSDTQFEDGFNIHIELETKLSIPELNKVINTTKLHLRKTLRAKKVVSSEDKLYSRFKGKFSCYQSNLCESKSKKHCINLQEPMLCKKDNRIIEMTRNVI